MQSGELSVFIESEDNTEYVIKKVYSGDSIFSLLSILDIVSVSLTVPFKEGRG